ncbi:MAG: prolipoprotein diacylglyceryl transferase [Patescibacteria group bacterium]
MFQSPGAVAFHLGPLTIHWYGILIGTGVLLCYSHVLRECKRRGINPKAIDDMAFWVVLAGVLGARIYYIIFEWGHFAADPWQVFQIWNGGLAIHGALIGGGLALAYFAWRHKLPWLLYADIISPGVLLAQALGRWGNFFNSEAFGAPTSLPWKLFIPESNRPSGYEEFEFYHPTFLYESLWNFAGFVMLIWLARQKKMATRRGMVFFAYIAWYSFGRFFIEGLRMDSLYLGSLRVAQIVSAVSFFFAVYLIFRSKKSSMRDTH